MKANISSKVRAITLAGFVLTMLMVSTGLAWKGGDSGGVFAMLTPCTDEASAFPTSLFTRLNKNRNGFTSGFEIHLSNTDGDCSVMLFSSNADESTIGLTGRQSSSDGVIDW